MAGDDEDPPDPDVPYEEDAQDLHFNARFATWLEEGRLELAEDGSVVTGPCPRCGHPARFSLDHETVVIVVPEAGPTDAVFDLDVLHDGWRQRGADQEPVFDSILVARCGCEDGHGREGLTGCGLAVRIEAAD